MNWSLTLVRQQVLYFLLSTLVLTLYIDVVLSLSISVRTFAQYKLLENFMDFANQLLNSSIGRRL